MQMTPPGAFARPDPAPEGREPPDLRSEDLLAGCPCVRIHHEGKIYTLRATRQGKLLLTK